MHARHPEDLDRLFVERLNAADLDGLVALYEPDATFSGAPGHSVSGRRAIGEALAGFLDAKPRMHGTTRVVARSGDLALLTTAWDLAMTGPDGKPAAMQGHSVEVARQQQDGHWLFVIDEPFGVGA